MVTRHQTTLPFKLICFYKFYNDIYHICVYYNTFTLSRKHFALLLNYDRHSCPWEWKANHYSISLMVITLSKYSYNCRINRLYHSWNSHKVLKSINCCCLIKQTSRWQHNNNNMFFKHWRSSTLNRIIYFYLFVFCQKLTIVRRTL